MNDKYDRYKNDNIQITIHPTKIRRNLRVLRIIHHRSTNSQVTSPFDDFGRTYATRSPISIVLVELNRVRKWTFEII